MTTRGRSSYYILTNKSGGSVTEGQVVVPSTGTDSAFTTTTTSPAYNAIGTVWDDTIANNADGIIAIHGDIVPVLATSAAVTRGHYIKHGTTAGKVITTGVLSAPGTKPPVGSIGIALTGVGAAGNIVAFLFPAAVLQSPNYSPENSLASQNAMDDEFNDETGMSGPTNGLDAQWTWRNQGTATATLPQVGLLKIAVPASATNNLRGIEQTIPADGAWDVYCSLQADATDFAEAGLWMIDNANGDIYSLMIVAKTVAANVRTYIQTARWTNVTTYLSDPLTSELGTLINGAWLRLELNAGNIIASYSTDGISYIRMGSFADAVGVTRVGLFANESNNSGRTAGFFKHFRRST